MKALLNALFRDYIRRGGVRCPFCGHEDIQGDSVNIEAGEAWQEVWCGRCERVWHDVYRLALVVHATDPAQDPDEYGAHVLETVQGRAATVARVDALIARGAQTVAAAERCARDRIQHARKRVYGMLNDNRGGDRRSW